MFGAQFMMAVFGVCRTIFRFDGLIIDRLEGSGVGGVRSLRRKACTFDIGT